MAISSGDRNVREPTEGNPSPPADGDASSPAVDPAEDDDLEELVEDDSNNDNGTSGDAEPVSASKPKVTFAAPATVPKASINPYPFGHINTPKKNNNSKASLFSGGAIPTFGDASSAIGNRPFDPKPFVKASEDDDGETPERKNFLGISPATRPTPPAPAADTDNDNNTARPFAFGVRPAGKDGDDDKRVQFSFEKQPSPSDSQSSSLSGAKKLTFSFSGDGPHVPPAASTPSLLKPVAFGGASGVGAFGASAPLTTAGLFGAASSSAAKSLSFGTNTSPKNTTAFGTSATSQPTTASGFGNLPSTSKSATVVGFGAAASKSTAFGKPSAFGGASLSPFSFASGAAQVSGGGIFGDAKKNDNDSDRPGAADGDGGTKSWISSFGTNTDGNDGTKSWKSSFGSSETTPSKPIATTDAPTPFATSAAPSPFGSAVPTPFSTGTSLQFGKATPFGTSSGSPFGAASSASALAAAPVSGKVSASASSLAAITPFGTVSPKSSAFGAVVPSIAMKTPREKSPFGGSIPMPEMDGEKKSPYPFGSSPKYADSSSAFGARNSQSIGKLFTGEIPKFGSLSSPGNSGNKRVSTPLFGLGSSAAQTAPVKFSKRASFQTSLSPNAAVFVPGASLFKPTREDGKGDIKADSNAGTESEAKSSPGDAAVKTAADASIDKASGPKDIPEKKMADVVPKKEEDSMEVSKPRDLQTVSEPKPTTSSAGTMEVVSRAPSREWSHVFEGVNLMIVTPSTPGIRKAQVSKKKSVFKLDIFQDERGLRIELICTQSIDDTVNKVGDLFISWELGADKMKVNRIKNRTTHAAMTRLGNAIPTAITEDNPAKIFVVFKNGEECAKFLDICSNPHLQMPQPTQPAVPASKNKDESSEEKEVSGSAPPPLSEETPTASPPLSTPVQSKDTEEEEGKTHTQAEGSGTVVQKSSAAALAAKKKLLMQKMKLAEARKSRGKSLSLPSGATPSGSASASDEACTEKKRPLPTAATEKVNAPTVPQPADPAPAATTAAPSWAAQGTKRTASAALEIEEPKKQKKMVEGTTTATADANINVKSDLEEFKKKERAAREDLKKQIDVLTAKMAELKEDNARADKMNKSLLVDIREMKAAKSKDTAAIKGVVAAIKKLKRAIRPVKEEKAVSLAVSEKLKACNPKSREEFFERLWTFKPSTWIGFAEIGKLDPVQCAMHGWYNCDKNQLRSSEGAEIYMNEDTYLSKDGDEEVKRVRENITGMAHPILSAWRGTKCPDEFAEEGDIKEDWYEVDAHDETMVRCKWCGRKSCKSQVKSKKKSLLHYKHCAYLSQK